MSHLLRVLIAVLVLAVPGVALAQCTKDTDCKGERVCERGACITPAERAPPAKPEYTPPPPPPPVQTPAARPPPRQHPAPGMEGSWEARQQRKNILSYNLFSTIYGALAAFLYQPNDPGLTILQLAFVYERALLPNLSLTAAITPNLWTDAAGTLPYCGITVGAKYYIFGDAPSGWWAGAELGTLALNLGPGMAIEGGYQWLFDSGLMVGLAGGVTFAGPQNGQIGISYGPGLGGLIGWNF